LPKNIPTITFLRGIASLLVCFQHLIGVGNLQGETYLKSDNLLWLLHGFGYAGVYIFFTISAFIIPYSLYQNQYQIKSFFSYLLKRAIRLDPPYWLRLLSIVLIIMFFPSYKVEPDTFDMGRFFAHLFYMNWYFDYEWFSLMYWTLEIEFQFYIVIGLCYNLLTHKNKNICYFSLIVFLFLTYITPNSYTVFAYGEIFLVGILAFLYYTKYFTYKEFIIFLVFTTIIALTKQPLKTLPPSLLTIICILWLNLDSKIGDFLGKISYSLYLVHAPVGQRLIYQSFTFIQNPVLRTTWVIFAIFIAILAAYIYYLLIEKPFIKLSKKIRFA
jgi:peptidoglycan/LPS O-acetylase OafA/YrhL